jgi:hypothetical protein
VVAAARVAFLDALHLVAAVAAVGAVLTAIAATIALWKVPPRSEEPADAEVAVAGPVTVAD